ASSGYACSAPIMSGLRLVARTRSDAIEPRRSAAQRAAPPTTAPPLSGRGRGGARRDRTQGVGRPAGRPLDHVLAVVEDEKRRPLLQPRDDAPPHVEPRLAEALGRRPLANAQPRRAPQHGVLLGRDGGRSD